MALIVCEECGGQVSDKAAACPHCGYPMKEQSAVHIERELIEKEANDRKATWADTVNKIADKAQSAVNSTATKIRDGINEKKEAADLLRQNEVDKAMEEIDGTGAAEVVRALSDSPVELTKIKIDRIKKVFPIPREQCVLWADAEFDLRPSGIVCTEKGLFIRSNVDVWQKKQKDSDAKASETNKSVLYYYRWDAFDPAWFTADSEETNKALTVEPQCREHFISACKSLAPTGNSQTNIDEVIISADDEAQNETIAKVAPVTGAAVQSAEANVFVENHSHVHTPAGHGEMAEEAITLLDRLSGLDAKVIGRDNAKHGADRLVNGIYVQTKYYDSARGSLEACFDPQSGNYLYLNEDKTPMQLEVPKDQYHRVLDGFKQKILKGKVPGVKDPNEAYNLVREGRYTYREAVNLTKPGTIESLTYDALTGIITSSCVFGFTFVITVYLTWRKTGDLRQSIQAGAAAGIQTFGLSFFQHMVVAQLSRTSLSNVLLTPSNYIVDKIGQQASTKIVNSLRALSGKVPLHGVAATRHLAKILRSSALTSVLTYAVFSIPETYNLAARKMSGAQYSKNMSVLAGSMAGSAGGSVAAGAALSKVAGAAGTAIAPGVGTVVGIAGGFVGGMVAGKAVDMVGDILHEDDVETLGRLFNAIVSCMISEYMLDDDEIDKLLEHLGKISQKEFKTVLETTRKANRQEDTLRNFLAPIFDDIVSERERFRLPSDAEIFTTAVELVDC